MKSKLKYSVLVDGYNLALPKGTGVATYARVLLKMLSDMGLETSVLYGLDVSEKNNFDLKEVLFFDKLGSEIHYKRPRLFSNRWCKQIISHFQGHALNEIEINNKVEYPQAWSHCIPFCDHIFNIPFVFQMAIGFFRKTGRFLTIKNTMKHDIVHWSYPLPIKVSGAKNIYTIHDIVPLKMPFTTLDDKIYYYKLIESLLHEADHICTVSERSKKDILDFFPDFSGKIYNTYQSIINEPIEKSYEMTAREVERFCGFSDKGFFLYFGQLEPKKNIGRLIEAFLLSDSRRPLVLIGSNGWKEENELKYLKKGIDMKVIFHFPYLSRNLLTSLLRHARAVLFPSISEGFGLPILEAFSLGTPVLTSDIGALQEVASNAALLVNPYDINDIRVGIEKLDKNDDLCDALRKRGQERALFFSEEEYKKRLFFLYQNVCKN